jgi:stage V sporulation protein S
MEVLKVSSKSNPNSVAGAMAGVIRQAGAVEVQVVGAGALNQAIKAMAIARGYVAPSGLDLVCAPTFADIEIDGESRTAIRLLLESRTGGPPGVVARGQATVDLRAAEGQARAHSETNPKPALA